MQPHAALAWEREKRFMVACNTSGFMPGDPVHIVEGTFRGAEGTVVGVHCDDTVVSVNFAKFFADQFGVDLPNSGPWPQPGRPRLMEFREGELAPPDSGPFYPPAGST